ncbi:hypothetical protein PanWU01x14_252720 [Parasponia andersonii]|uniref:Uncharacterized protein n=1 Tax=Parasponia andersonii TaxID=3476 RepID=A0A2P5BBU2_PARAD|nr:hypothetical protein PanWU01x14_252720 [Parasponia andersonii]
MAACPHGSFPSVHPSNVSYLINLNGCLVLTRWWRKPASALLLGLNLDLDNQWKLSPIVWNSFRIGMRKRICLGLSPPWSTKLVLYLTFSLELHFLLFLDIVTSLLTMLPPRGLLLVIVIDVLATHASVCKYYQSWL